ncbi:MAG: 16S rRNA (uracil(1498)-N(3))-methyltransferase [Bacteroidaceae bacterium]|nr:16S rRNA (uracil(1498)-N(3))-methyltransferase [Bacteroidaceae bacterium]
MKEERFFYQPDIGSGELSRDEASHAVRVLRLKEGDELWLMDGKGRFHRAEITLASNHRCAYRIVETLEQERAWEGRLHLAVAPTKLIDRMEWLAEKATEIGLDELSFLDCQFSERRIVKTERIEKIVVSAMKQSHKAWKPVVSNVERFKDFITRQHPGGKYICHCYEGDKPYLLDVLKPGADATVLIGPEGDFSIEEVRMAEANGWQAVSLGRSRLRTETAALVAVHLMQIKNQTI